MLLQRENYPDPAGFYYPEALREAGYIAFKLPSPFPREEYESLVYDSDLPAMSWPDTVGFGLHFASVASPDGSLDVRPFGNADHCRAEKDGQWTPNALRCPGIVRWVEDVGANFGTVRVLRKSNVVRDLTGIEDARKLYHRDTTNLYNPPRSGWIVRVLLQITDNPGSYMLVQGNRGDPDSERRIALSRGTCVLFDADLLWHTVWHPADTPRYALVVSFESSPRLDEWIDRAARQAGSAIMTPRLR